MRVGLKIEYSADAESGETPEQEQAALDAIGRAVETFVEAVERNCTAEGLTVTISR